MPPISPDLLKALGGLGGTSLVFLAFAVVAFLLWMVIKAVATGALTGGNVIQHTADMISQEGLTLDRIARTLDQSAQGQEQTAQLLRNLSEDVRELSRDVRDLARRS